MTIQDNYMFRPLRAIFRLYPRELKVLIYIARAPDGEISTSGSLSDLPATRPQLAGRKRNTPLSISANQQTSNSILATRPYRASSQSIRPIQHTNYILRNKALCRELSITCARNIYSRTSSSLGDHLRMASKCRNM